MSVMAAKIGRAEGCSTSNGRLCHIKWTLVLALVIGVGSVGAQTCSNTGCPNGGGPYMCTEQAGSCTLMQGCQKCLQHKVACPCDTNCQCKLSVARQKAVLYWNAVAMSVLQLDYDMDGHGQPLFGGPTAASRAQAIVHGAIHDAVVGIVNRDAGALYLTAYTPSSVPCAGRHQCSLPNGKGARAAVGEAAFRTLSSLYNNATKFGALLSSRYDAFMTDLRAGDSTMYAAGVAWGAVVSATILKDRADDGSAHPEDPNYNTSSTAPFVHQPDPLNPDQGFQGSAWGDVRPFLFVSTASLRASATPLPDPRPDGAAQNPYGPYLPGPATRSYVEAYHNINQIGSLDAPARTPEELDIGLFWAYDGAKDIGVPIRLYNQLVRAIVLEVAPYQQRYSEAKLARVFALANFVMADCGIQAWYEKYKWRFWRPVVGVRAGTASPGQVGYTVSRPNWMPFGTRHTNGDGAFTPNFPSYPSGHATFGAGVFRAVQAELDLPSNFTFGFMSDEMNGHSFDVLANGTIVKRSCAPQLLTISSAIYDNMISRIYLGVHWIIDGVQGVALGEQLAQMVSPQFPKRV